MKQLLMKQSQINTLVKYVEQYNIDIVTEVLNEVAELVKDKQDLKRITRDDETALAWFQDYAEQHGLTIIERSDYYQIEGWYIDQPYAMLWKSTNEGGIRNEPHFEFSTSSNGSCSHAETYSDFVAKMTYIADWNFNNQLDEYENEA